MGPFDALWLAAAVRLATPLLLAGIGELIAERSGVINIGLEGMMLMGAFWGYWGAWATGDIWLGVLVALAAGAALAAVMALIAVRFRGDQIVAGVGLNLLAAGITTFAFRDIFTGSQVVLHPMSTLAIPGLSSLPVIGNALFNQIPLVYLAYCLVPIAWFVLYRTTWGMAIRSVGERPEAADAAGISVEKTRWTTTIIAGAGAGLGGAVLSIGQLGFFTENMSAGRGFLALAAVVFGAWRPLGVLGACLLFGAADALQLRLQATTFVPHQVWLALAIVAAIWVIHIVVQRRPARNLPVGEGLFGAAVLAGGITLFFSAPHWSLPAQLWIAAPYIVTLVALAGAARSARVPAALTLPFRRGGEV